MKQGFVALSAFAWLQLAAAGCCRTNKCLKAVVANPEGIDGVAECASLLAFTVTPEASTVTETITEVPTEYASLVDTAVFTETVTTTVSTDTQLFTEGTSVTASTYTHLVTVTRTVLATQTLLTSITTNLPAASTRILARDDTELGPAIPTYAAADCPSWDKYVSACNCAGITATTVTAEAPSATTVTVSYTDSAVVISVPTTISTTETVFESVTATTAVTDVDTALITATVSATETVEASSTVTITQIVTQTVQPQATCLSSPGAFQPWYRHNSVNVNPLHIYANMLNALSGGLTWNQGTTSTSPAVKNKYIWTINAEGYLELAYQIPPYTYKYVPYISTAMSGSAWPQIGTEASVLNSINNGGQVARMKACVNSVTNELTLEAAGRRNILYCGQQLWMSSGLGEDVNRGSPCVQFFPKAALGY
ncbi:hypothetical protein QBC44DRAFT_232875 [Cladorrhinum sp. PSN332]|nr:hypothetical protein QBC44DRAFT_232875 [Cladorrhinum sp. PSN332]